MALKINDISVDDHFNEQFNFILEWSSRYDELVGKPLTPDEKTQME